MKKIQVFIYRCIKRHPVRHVHLLRGLSGRQQKSELSGRITSDGNDVTAVRIHRLGCRNGVFVPTLRFYVVTALHAESVIQPIYHAGQLCDDFFQRPPSVENSVRGRFA